MGLDTKVTAGSLIGEKLCGCLAFVDTLDGRDTVIGLFNYFIDNYAAEAVIFTGRKVDPHSATQLADEVLFDIRSDRPQYLSLSMREHLGSFCGNVAITAELIGGRSPPHILQAWKAYIHRDGTITSQHAEGPIRTINAGLESWGYDLDPQTPDVELLIQNHSPDLADHAVFEIFRGDGSATGLALSRTLAPLEIARVRLAEALPGWVEACGHRRASGRITHRINPQRTLFRVHDGPRFIINHGSGTGDTPVSKPLDRIERHDISDNFRGEVLFALPLGDDAPYEFRAFIDNFFWPEEAYPLHVSVHDQTGRMIGEDRRYTVLAPHALCELSEAAIRSHFSLDPAVCGHVMVSVGPGSDGRAPRARICQTLHVGERKTGGMINGGYIQNMIDEPGTRGRGARRNRTFAPIALGEGLATTLYIQNASSRPDYTGDADYTLTFFTEQGMRLRHEGRIAAGAMQKLCLNRILSDHGAAGLTRGNRHFAWAELRSLQAQLPGIYVFYDESAGWADLDHMFGG